MKLFRKVIANTELIRFLKFSIVGGIGLVVNTVALYLLTTFVFGERLYLFAAALSLEISIINNFLLNEYWTFRDRTAGGGFFTRMVKFHGSRTAGFFTTLAVLFVLTEWFGVFYLISNIVSVLVGMAINYLTSNYWVWQ